MAVHRRAEELINRRHRVQRLPGEISRKWIPAKQCTYKHDTHGMNETTTTLSCGYQARKHPLFPSTEQHKSHCAGRSDRLTAAGCCGVSWRTQASSPVVYMAIHLLSVFSGGTIQKITVVRFAWHNCLSALEDFIQPQVLLGFRRFPFHDHTCVDI